MVSSMGKSSSTTFLKHSFVAYLAFWLESADIWYEGRLPTPIYNRVYVPNYTAGCTTCNSATCYMCSYNPNLKHCPYTVQSSHHSTTMHQLPEGSLFKAAQHRQSVAFYEACRGESLSETALGHHDFKNYCFFGAN